jgi:hypothetical protein
MQIAGVGRIGMKLLERLNARVRSPTAARLPWFLALLCPAMVACPDSSDKLDRLRVTAFRGRSLLEVG